VSKKEPAANDKSEPVKDRRLPLFTESEFMELVEVHSHVCALKATMDAIYDGEICGDHVSILLLPIDRILARVVHEEWDQRLARAKKETCPLAT
jgi:hypothetical protein